jgi:hypothetical protein
MLRNVSVVIMKASKRASIADISPALSGLPAASGNAGAEKSMLRLGDAALT